MDLPDYLHGPYSTATGPVRRLKMILECFRRSSVGQVGSSFLLSCPCFSTAESAKSMWCLERCEAGPGTALGAGCAAELGFLACTKPHCFGMQLCQKSEGKGEVVCKGERVRNNTSDWLRNHMEQNSPEEQGLLLYGFFTTHQTLCFILELFF